MNPPPAVINATDEARTGPCVVMCRRRQAIGVIGLLCTLVLPWLIAFPAMAAATAYICEDGSGHRSIQDRPCAAASSSRAVDIEARAAAPAVSSEGSRPPSVAGKPQRRVDRGWSARDASRCRQYQEGKFQLQSRMRAGYTVSEGERLRSGLDKLNGMLESRCRKVPQRYWVRGNASDKPPG